MGVGVYKTSKRRAESIRFENVEDLMEKLGISGAKFCELFCDVSYSTFKIWKRRGLIPCVYYYAAQKALSDYFYREYQEKMKLIDVNE